MEHTLTLELSNTIYEPLTKTARQTGKTPEQLAIEWLEQAAHIVLQDPLEDFIGVFHSDVPDWADEHDKYLGQALAAELHDADTQD
jgi:hypothetical protein